MPIGCIARGTPSLLKRSNPARRSQALKPGVPARAAFDENLTHYKQQMPALCWFNALLIALNGTDSCVGLLTADWEVLAHGHLLRVETHRAR